MNYKTSVSASGGKKTLTFEECVRLLIQHAQVYDASHRGTDRPRRSVNAHLMFDEESDDEYVATVKARAVSHLSSRDYGKMDEEGFNKLISTYMWYILDRMPEASQRLLFEYGFSFAITDFGDYLEKKRIKFWDNNGDLIIPICDVALKACFEDKYKIELHGDKVFDLEFNNNNFPLCILC